MTLTKEHSKIEYLVNQYAKSITEADTTLAAAIWSTTEDASYIHPKGHHHGWNEILENFYGKLMRDKFSRRNLRVHDLEIECYDRMAVAVFYWEFNATWRIDGSLQHTEGRETQVFRHTGDKWLLVHLHYSNMPVTGEREGF